MYLCFSRYVPCLLVSSYHNHWKLVWMRMNTIDNIILTAYSGFYLQHDLKFNIFSYYLNETWKLHMHSAIFLPGVCPYLSNVFLLARERFPHRILVDSDFLLFYASQHQNVFTSYCGRNSTGHSVKIKRIHIPHPYSV